MSVVEPQPAQPNEAFDGLLRRFFRSQLPNPWPSPRLPSAPSHERRPAAGLTLVRSRWVLAASVALLLLGSMLLPNRFTQEAKPESGLSGPIIGEKPGGLHKQPKKQKNGENKTSLRIEDDDPFPNLNDSDVPGLR